MKFMITWRVHENQRHEALKVFSGMTDEEAAAEFGDLAVVGRWHDLIGFTGVAIVEADDPNLLTAWLIKWNSMCDIQTVPVMDDDEARAFGRQALS